MNWHRASKRLRFVYIGPKRGSGKLRRATRRVHLRQVDEKRPNHRCASSAVHKSGCGRSPADNSPSFRPTDKPESFVRSSIASCSRVPKSTSITRASPQCRDFRCNQDTAEVWMFAHLLHALVASGIDSRVHLTRILAQHSAHSCPSRLRSLALKPVSPPCHSPCTSPCARFGYN